MMLGMNAPHPAQPVLSLSPSDTRRLRTCAAQHAHRGRFHGQVRPVRDQALVEFALASGLTSGELARVLRSDVEVELADDLPPAVVVRVAAGTLDRAIPLERPGATVVASYLDWLEHIGLGLPPGAPLFGGPGGRALSQPTLHRVWKRALAEAGLPSELPFSSTRRHYAETMFSRTGDLRLLQHRLGLHSRRSARRWLGSQEHPSPAAHGSNPSEHPYDLSTSTSTGPPSGSA